MQSELKDTIPWLHPAAALEAMKTGDGEGVRVAVLDSGIERSHPRLSDLRLRDSVSIAERDGRLGAVECEPEDAYGHGTGVAGIIHEIAPRAEIGSFQVLDARNLSRTAIIREGVREAMRRGYHILNCSFGCKGQLKYLLPHKEWIDEAYLNGLHTVAACNNFDPTEPEWPGHFTSVIAVNMATVEPDEIYYRKGHIVEFAALGERVEVLWKGGGTRVQTGSSFAAPRVTGYLARLLSVAPGLPPAHVIDLLQRVARPWPPACDFDPYAERPTKQG